MAMTSREAKIPPPIGIVYLSIISFLVHTVSAAPHHHQEFSVVPQSVEVVEGADVFLSCVVDHQQGKAQWTKDGFALGFERTVPGYPRYSYAGDPDLGEHHLVISGVTLTEDGEYQCQVGPTDTTPPIWAAANVTVLLAPSAVGIMGWGDGAVVEVVEGTTLTLECVVTDGRPPPQAAWYRAGLQVDPAIQVDRIEPSTSPRRWTVTSQLRVTALAADDGRLFSCQAVHPTLENGPTSLVASVTLSVLHTPGPPIITGYDPSEVILAGERRTLSCKSSGGNPRPWVLWYRQGRLLDDTTTTLRAGGGVDDLKEVQGVVNDHELAVTPGEDGAVYECRVTSDLLEFPLTSNVTLTVYYAPSSLTIKGLTQVEVGGAVNLTCETSDSNPPASLTWTIQGEVQEHSKSVVGKDGSGGWVTSSHLIHRTVTSNNQSEVTLECRALNPAIQEVIKKTTVVTIIRPAGRPVFEADLNDDLMAGTSLDLTCVSVGGHPPPSIRVFKGEEELATETRTEAGLTRARLEVELTPADNGVEVSCQVDNPALSTPLHTASTLSVLFPPWDVSGRVTPTTVEEGKVATLTCEASSSLPASNITWRSQEARLEGAILTTSPGLFGGTDARSELHLMTTAEDNGRSFRCEAENGLGVAVKTKLVLNVLHSPVWVVRPPEQLDVYEGAELVVTASADANPGPLRYWWRRGEETLEATAGELRLGRISRKSTGNYTVNGYNPRGAVNASFHLNVQYGPENVQSAERVTVGERGAATVECSAHANPTPTLTWTRDSHNSTTQTISSGVGVARLVLESASWADTGVYLCHASNLVSSAPPVVTSIIVTQAPTVVTEVAGAGGTWAAVGGDGRLVCRVRAAPAPTFSWATQDGVEILDSEKYYMLEPQLVDGLVLWAGVLEVRKVERNDYTTYVCSATNALGSDTAHLTLNPPARPHPPSNFTVTNVTEATVSLSWTPNFQAGLPRGYTLRYRPAGTLEYQLIDISGGNTAGTTLGGLRAGVDYFFSIQASNDQGRSHYLTPPLLVTLLAGASGSSGSSSSRWRIPRLILVIMTLTGAALLVLNVVIIACFVRRRSLARHTSGSSSHKTVALETYCNTPVSTPGHHHHPEVLLSLNTATNNTRTSNTVASYKEDQLTSVERRGRSDSGVSNREGRPGVTRLQNGGVSRKNSNGSSSQNGGVIVRNASGNLNVENDNGGGTLRQNGGVPSVTSPAACVNGGGGSSPTTTPLNARMVPAPQGHVHPPTNPEVCSLTSSTYDTHASVSHHKRRDSGSLPADDQVSLSSYQSTHSRTYSQGYVRPLPPPGCPHHPATRSQPLYPGAVGRPYPQQEQQTKQQQQKQQQQQPAGPPTYSSLNPSSLYSLSSEYYDARCSQSSFSPGAPMGYSTLGPRSRRSNPSQFATLQRPRASRTPVPYNPQSTGHQCATPAPQRQGGDCCQQCHLKSSEDDYHSVTVCQGHQDMADPHHLHQHLRRSSFHGPLRRDTQRHDAVCPASQHGAVSAGYGTTQHQNSISPQYSTVQHPDGDNTPHSSLAQEYNTTQGSSPPNNNRGQQLHPHRCHAHSTTCTSQTNLSTPQDAPLQDLSPACASPSRQRTASLRSSSFRSGGSQEDPTCSSTNSTRQKNVPLRTSSSFKSNALPQDSSSPSCDSPTRQRQATLRASSSFKSDVPRKDPVAAAAGRPRFPHDYVRQGSGKTRSSSTSKTTTNDAAADKVKLTSTFSDPS